MVITQVCRAISAMVNDIDDRGVISGNWSGNYTGPTILVAIM